MIRSTCWGRSAALSAAVLLASCSAPPPESAPDRPVRIVSHVDGVAGGSMVDTVKVKARVTAIDHARRVATIERADGESMTVSAGPESANFDQVAAGDIVEAKITRTTVVHVAAAAVVPDDAGGASVVAGPAGAGPGGLAMGTVRFVATVEALDVENRTATVRFEEGSVATLAVRPDVDMTLHKVGEKLVFNVTGTVDFRVLKR